jgi:hypothetical protein
MNGLRVPIATFPLLLQPLLDGDPPSVVTTAAARAVSDRNRRDVNQLEMQASIIVLVRYQFSSTMNCSERQWTLSCGTPLRQQAALVPAPAPVLEREGLLRVTLMLLPTRPPWRVSLPWASQSPQCAAHSGSATMTKTLLQIDF